MLKQTLVAVAAALTLNAASAATLTTNEFFSWVENEYPMYFPKGKPIQQIDFQGCTYDYKQYGPDYYLGVCRKDEGIYSYTGGTLKLQAKLDDFKCQARPDFCGAATFAGTLMFSADSGGTSVTFNANYRSNKLWGVGADGKGFEILVAKIDALCAHSIRLANWDKSNGIGCSKPQVNGELRITGLPNNDCSRFTAWSEGKEYWVDLGTATGWKFSGLNAKLNASCGIEYGPRGFQAAKVYSVREPDNTASLVWDFGSDFVGGFGSVQFDIADKAKVYAFVLNGEHQGKDYSSGWGLGAGRKTKEGFEIQPSIRMAWLETDQATGHKFLKFRNLACSDKVNATAYVGTGPADKVVYDFGRDGFGLGWASVGGSAPFWTAGAGVTIDSAKSQAQYGVPFCTQK